MASNATIPGIAGSAPAGVAALQHRHWRRPGSLSSMLEPVEHFLAGSRFDRAPWLVVSYAAGIAAWFMLDNPGQWLSLICASLALGLCGLAAMRKDGRFPLTRLAVAATTLMLAAGCGTIWAKSALTGEAAIARPIVATFDARVLDREDRPADARVRLMLATQEPGTGRAIMVRVNLPMQNDDPAIAEGAIVRLRARLMPPAAPMLPGGYDFARTAWFSGIAATGSVLGRATLMQKGGASGWLDRIRTRLSRHVRLQLGGSPGTIASAFASGDRGAIAKEDDTAMRDAGLTHLLSISGLHVSAVIAAAYALAIRLLALWPWLALRLRLPLVAAATGAGAGVFYTLITGAEVPTVRSCIGAVLILVALALGREPLSLRLLAAAAFLVLLAWPEAVVSPGFQMSFASVIAIVSLHGAAPVHAFLAPREQPWWELAARRIAMLLLTGLVIELALLPIGLYHFHRAGVYGAVVNVIAIPLTTFVTMPLIAIALLLDSVGAGAPAWWLTGKSLELLLAMAHWTAARPGAVTLLPAMGLGSVLLFTAGGLWLALWRGNVRLAGLLPVIAGTVSLLMLRPPDLLVSGDGHHVGITGEGGEMLMLRETRSDFARENLTELAGMNTDVRLIADWPGARCNRDFCALVLRRSGRDWRVLIGRGKDAVPERALDAACERVDIVIADRWLPRSCHPAWFKADTAMLARTGGLAIDLEDRRLTTVAEGQGEHGWWRVTQRKPFRTPVKPAGKPLS